MGQEQCYDRKEASKYLKQKFGLLDLFMNSCVCLW